MVTFNVDSLDFVDDEEARFGADTDFATRFDSSNQRLELEDLTNASVSYVPTNVGTDLVGGKFAETVAEGKALADDGNVYDSIQEAVNSASSWVKVGPGEFQENIRISTQGMTIEGCGERTTIRGIKSRTISLAATDVTIRNIRLINEITDCIRPVNGENANGLTVRNCYFEGANFGIYGWNGNTYQSNWSVINSRFNTDSSSIIIQGNAKIIGNNILSGVGDAVSITPFDGDDNIIAYNVIRSAGNNGIELDVSDSIVICNIIIDSDSNAIELGSTGSNSIVAKNQIINSGDDSINDQSTGAVIDSNQT